MWAIGPVPTTPPDGPVGLQISGPESVSIGGTLTFRTSRLVLNPIWPVGARKVIVSNDAHFTNSTTFSVGSSIPWTHPQVLSGTVGSSLVYIKFTGNKLINPNTVYTRAFSWDLSDPFLTLAARTASSTFHAGTWKVRLSGGDKGTGLRLVQFWMKRTGQPTAPPVGLGPGYVAGYSALVTVPGAYMPVWARVSDAAGNWSKWYLIR